MATSGFVQFNNSDSIERIVAKLNGNFKNVSAGNFDTTNLSKSIGRNLRLGSTAGSGAGSDAGGSGSGDGTGGVGYEEIAAALAQSREEAQAASAATVEAAQKAMEAGDLAEAAADAAEDARALAAGYTQYVWADDAGLHVTTEEEAFPEDGDSPQPNLLLNSQGLDIYPSTTAYNSGRACMHLTKNDIKFMGEDELDYGYLSKDGLVLKDGTDVCRITAAGTTMKNGVTRAAYTADGIAFYNADGTTQRVTINNDGMQFRDDSGNVLAYFSNEAIELGNDNGTVTSITMKGNAVLNCSSLCIGDFDDPIHSRAELKGDPGVPGEKGADGVTYYTWIKYADTPTSGMSDYPDGKEYMGIAYNKETAVESMDYSDYEWSLFKGDQGVPGGKGEDGTTYYTWIKYADDASGTNMSDDPDGKAYLGLAYNKTTPTESSVASDYQWSKIQGDGIDNVVNMYLATSLSSGVTKSTSGWTSTIQTMTETKKYLWNYEECRNGTDVISSSDPVIIGTYSKDGTNGKGISSITEYYAYSTSNTYVSGSWSTSVPTLTNTYKYLWNYEYIVYSDGTSSTTSKRVIGVYGDKGDPGTDGKDGTDVTSQYVYYNSNYGLAVTPTANSTTGKHVQIKTDGFYIKDGDSELASFKDNTIKLNSSASSGYIYLPGGGLIKSDNSGWISLHSYRTGGSSADSFVCVYNHGEKSATDISGTTKTIYDDGIRIVAYDANYYMDGGGLKIHSAYGSNLTTTNQKVYISAADGNITTKGTITADGNITTKGTITAGTYNVGTSDTANCRISTSGTYKGQIVYLKSQSLRRLKHDIKDLSDESVAAEKLYDIPVRQFIYNNDYLAEGDMRYGKILPGFIAEEVEECYPRGASYGDSGELENWSVRTLLPPMLKLIQDQKKLIDALTARVATLEKKAE